MTQTLLLPLLSLENYNSLCEQIFDQFKLVAVIGRDVEDCQFSQSASNFPDIEEKLVEKVSEIEISELLTGISFGVQMDEHGKAKALRAFARGITDVHDNHICTLVVVTGEQQPRQDARQLLSLDAVYETVANECSIGLELDSVIGELTDRYEELNLIYGTDDNSESFNQIHPVLSNLVTQCWERLNVNAAILYLPTQDICIVEETEAPLDAMQAMGTHLAEQIMPWTIDLGTTFVSNTPEEAGVNQHCSELQRKLICSPITKPSGSVCGFIAVFNTYACPDFSNSDRNLIEILARKASRVLNSNYDELTGLINRESFHSVANEILQSAQPEEEDVGALLLIELRNIHIVNDTLGTHAGDEMISSCARLLVQELPENSVLGRMDGRVFAVILSGSSIDAAEVLARKLMEKISGVEIQWQGHEASITLNMGLVQLRADMDAETQVANAKIALNVAGEKGVNVIEVQRPESDDIAKRRNRIQMLNLINDTLRNDRFELYAQGIFATDAREKPHHYEILLRYYDEDGCIKAPFPMIEAAEFYKVMPDIDRWVINKAIATLGSHWNELAASGIGWAINLSGQTFAQNGLLEYISAELAQSDVDNQAIAFEVTETVAINNLSAAREAVQAIKQLGCDFYLDDFGTGLSSFTYLMELPFDYVKIDGSFVKKIVEDDVSIAMVKAIAAVASTLNMRTVAEFVENDEIADILQTLGIDYLQGYGLHQPEPLKDIIERLSQSAVVDEALVVDDSSFKKAAKK